MRFRTRYLPPGSACLTFDCISSGATGHLVSLQAPCLPVLGRPLVMARVAGLLGLLAGEGGYQQHSDSGPATSFCMSFQRLDVLICEDNTGPPSSDSDEELVLSPFTVYETEARCEGGTCTR